MDISSLQALSASSPCFIQGATRVTTRTHSPIQGATRVTTRKHSPIHCWPPVAGFVIARELRVECDPFGGNSSIPDISAKSPYQKRKFKNLLPVNPPTFVPGEKEKRPKMPWLRPPRQHDVPKK